MLLFSEVMTKLFGWCLCRTLCASMNLSATVLSDGTDRAVFHIQGAPALLLTFWNHYIIKVFDLEAFPNS